jgi:hypothetical protein
MFQKMYEMKSLMNVAGATNAASAAGTAVDLTPSASIQRRECKVVIGYQVLTAGTFPIVITECATTNGTFTAMDGDTIADVSATQAAVGVVEYHMKPSKRYAKAAIGTVAGGGAAANLLVMLMNLKRAA